MAEQDETERTWVPAERRRGRGAASNASGRFERESRAETHDGWDIEEERPGLRTEVALESARTIISRNSSPDIPFDRSLNPYRGCEHGCVYCFARPTHAYLGLSPGLDFETKLTAKPNAPALLAKELAKPGYRVAPLAMGTNTDPYQPIERDYRIMRGVLEVLQAARHPLTIVTKSALITRDVDILGDMAQSRLACVGISVTTLDHRLARKLEPRASTPILRLRAIETLARAGVPTGVMVAPLIPALNDHEIEQILTAARDAGARWAEYVALRMPHEIKELFREWLEEHAPDRASRVLRYVREMHGGKDYDPEWGKRLRGEGVYAQMMGRRFRAARKRLGLDAPRPDLRCDLFQPPAAPHARKAAAAQLSLDL